jgi:hypothetical protein
VKTYKNLNPQVADFSNLYLAYRAARRAKRQRETVPAFEFDLEHNLLLLQEELLQHTYTPGEYHNFYIYEPNQRLVSAAPFRDRVVHHALCNLIEPLFERQFPLPAPSCVVEHRNSGQGKGFSSKSLRYGSAAAASPAAQSTRQQTFGLSLRVILFQDT